MKNLLAIFIIFLGLSSDFVFCAEVQKGGIEKVYLKKDENSPLTIVTVEQLKEELSNMALIGAN